MDVVAKRQLITIIMIFLGLWPWQSFAQNAPQYLSVAGGLFNPNGSPVTLASVDFRLELWDAAAQCVLYSEEHPEQNLATTRGGFALQLGRGINPINKLDDSTNFTAKLFANSGAVPAFTDCPTGVTFNSGDERLIRVYYDLGSGFVAMAPDVPLGSAPYALMAETVSGKNISELLQVKDDASTVLSQSNLESVFTSANFSALTNLLAGTSSMYMRSNPGSDISFNDQRLTNLAAPVTADDAVNKDYADGNVGGKGVDVSGVGAAIGDGRTLIWDAAAGQWTTGVPNGIDNSKLPLAGGTMSGPITLDGYDLDATGNVNISAGRFLQLGTFDNAGEPSIGAGDAGKTWFNTDLSAVRVWVGTEARTQAFLSSSGKLDPAWLPDMPSVDGSSLSNLNAIRLQGFSVASITPASNQILKWNGSVWAPAEDLGMTELSGDVSANGSGSVAATLNASAVTTTKIADDAITSAKLSSTDMGINRLLITDATTGESVVYATCLPNEILKWTANGWTCATVDSLASVTSVAGKTGAVSLNVMDVDGLGSAAIKNAGQGAGEVLLLDSFARIPAVDGGLLTNLNAALRYPLAADSGTAAAPTYSFSSDAGSGWFSPGAGLLAASTNSLERIRIDANGNVGIGTTSPTVRLQMQNSSWGEYIRFGHSAQGSSGRGIGVDSTGFYGTTFYNNGSPVAKIADDGGLALGPSFSATSSIYPPSGGAIIQGSVGIGTNTPTTKLEVSGTVTATQFNGSGAGLTGTATSLTAGAANSVSWLGISSKPTTLSGYGITDGVSISRTISTSTGLLGGGNLSANRTISVDIGTSASKIPQLDSGGRYPATAGFVAVTKDNISTRTDSGFYQTGNATTANGWPVTTNSWYHLLASTHTNDANYYSMQFAGNFYDSNELYYRASNGSGATGWNKVITANTSGNVGIGTTNPTTKLEVAGTVTATQFNGSGAGLTGTAAGLTAGAANSVAWSSVTGKPFNWSGQSGQPSWLWGSNDGANYYVWNPSNFVVNNVTALSGTWDGINYFRSNKGASSYVGSNSSYALQAYSTDGGAAGMSFHRGGAYAVNMGLDPDNVFRIGGWSAAANRWQLDMSGNVTIAGNHSISGQNYISNASPTIYLLDSDHRSAMIHNNSNTLYFLRGCGSGNASWCTTANGYWPLYLNLESNDAVFGNNVYAFGYFHNSDANLKKDIKTSPGLDIISRLRGVIYRWQHDDTQAAGVIAQEVEQVLPYAVQTNIHGHKAVDYDQLIGPLIESVKELKRQNESLRMEVDELRTELRILKERSGE